MRSPTTKFQKWSKVTSKHSGLQHNALQKKKTDKNTGKHEQSNTGGRPGKRVTGAEHQGNQGKPGQKDRKCKDTQKLHRRNFKIKQETEQEHSDANKTQQGIKKQETKIYKEKIPEP